MKNFYIFDLDGTLAASMKCWRRECAAEKADNDEAWERVRQRMKKHYAEDIEIKAGVPEFLRSAKERGVKMCIASATRRDIAEPFLSKTGILDFMEFYIDCDEAGAYKDEPAIFLLAAKRLGADIEDCVVFEDVPPAVASAKDAGFYVVGVYDEITVNDGNIRPYVDDYVEDWRTFKIKA
ncbi:MAG: HAD family hydrolase [Oscillospiraceae bacterium]